MKEKKTIIALLVVIAFLLAANLFVSFSENRGEARADIVGGKNIFSTHSPDGETVYLWGYNQTGGFNNAKVEAFYYGKITPRGFVKP